MNYFIKPMLWAGLGMLGAGAGLMNSADAKEPVKVAITAENRTDGHYETQWVDETRVDSTGNTYVVRVQRQVYVDDLYVSSPSYGWRYTTTSPYYYDSPYYYRSGPSFYFGIGGGHHYHHH